MKPLLCLILFLASTPAVIPPIRPADLVGSWRDHEGIIYVLQSDSSYRLTYADSIISGKWALHRDGRLELMPNGDIRNRAIIFIESLAKDVLHPIALQVDSFTPAHSAFGFPIYVAPLSTGSIQRVCHDTLPWLISFSLDPRP